MKDATNYTLVKQISVIHQYEEKQPGTKLLNAARITLYQVSLFIIKKILLLRCLHHFQSDLINKMDHMCIPGTSPSSVILIQAKKSKKLNLKIENVSLFTSRPSVIYLQENKSDKFGGQFT